eukprot:CAMPEP_0183721134 /NCGR_PEP_ID=MMETSP0737-20130205/13524_1 /TAXON_ID=385413 /ORGANISM="Thalassiosira miniscula, Strain CCMP1093" /LENGTH=407 /DNA_ID=CAMNT_0025951105 /DNA_START=63 /DNA_END=1286 /DNA_ORIENTATION=-
MTLSFDSLPQEVLRKILGYVDISSLGVLSVTQKADADNIASLASDDVTWYALIQNRFGIGCNHRRSSRKKKQGGVVLVKRGSSSSLSSDGNRSNAGQKRRPASYGGLTWKDSFRALSSTMRIPETSITSGSHNSGGGVFASPHLGGRTAKNSVADFFGVWCMVNHAENCRTKTVENQMRIRRRRRGHHDVVREPINLPYRTNRRYIELKLCLQNTKSGYGRVVIPDISAIRIASLEEEDYFSSWGWDKGDNEYDSTFQLVEVGPWAPRMLLRRRFGADDAAQYRDSDDVEFWNEKCGLKDIILRPFEVAVLSVHISCPDGLVYETDVLSSMSSIRVPIIADGWPNVKKKIDTNCCSATKESTIKKSTIKKKDVSISCFLSEDALWEYYCQLPGGCLSLTDRSRLVPM